MSDRLLKESDVLKIAFQLPLVVNSAFADAVKALPSADRPQGEWIVSSKDSICPICGKDEAEFICGTEDWYGYGLSNYCPNCGERMKGTDNE
jgi:RNA polymerase subunit RPABC4/transcription elongation factor Spt4